MFKVYCRLHWSAKQKNKREERITTSCCTDGGEDATSAVLLAVSLSFFLFFTYITVMRTGLKVIVVSVINTTVVSVLDRWLLIAVGLYRFASAPSSWLTNAVSWFKHFSSVQLCDQQTDTHTSVAIDGTCTVHVIQLITTRDQRILIRGQIVAKKIHWWRKSHCEKITLQTHCSVLWTRCDDTTALAG